MRKVPDPLPKSNGEARRDFGGLARVVRAARGLTRMRGSRIGRRILVFNLIAFNSLVLGILYLDASDDRVLRHRGDSLLQSATLVSGLVAARLPGDGVDMPLANGLDRADVARILQATPLAEGTEVWLFDRDGRLLGRRDGDTAAALPRPEAGPTPMIDGLMRTKEWLSLVMRGDTGPDPPRASTQTARALVDPALANGPHRREIRGAAGPELWAAAPIVAGSMPVAVVALADAPGALDGLIRAERERMLRIFVIAVLVSVGLSLTLASTISVLPDDPALAAGTARDRLGKPGASGAGHAHTSGPTECPDEIGRLSESLRGMVAALYQRIESNEQFAADVAHELRNPLTSLRCAVGTMRETSGADQRERLLDVIAHDVRRLDRLINDVACASRLDSDLVKEEQTRFDLLGMLRHLAWSLEMQALKKELTLLTDFPDQPVVITGLEARLSQVFVNLVANAISFCEPGGTIRLWARRRAGRVLVVVEDTGPGVSDGALEKIFERFYSSRPESEFGDHSGLGLAISKQIVEAHDGVIWAENIRPTEADATSEPLGMRFVVGLSV